jgi:KH domain-containing, RNA-binding, signal transduction-associated protein 2
MGSFHLIFFFSLINACIQEEDLRLSGDPRYAHLAEDLHVEISTFAAPAEAHARIAYALAEVRRFLVPVSTY